METKCVPRTDQFVPTEESTQEWRVKFQASEGLNRAIGQQNGNAIHDGITLSASPAPYRRRLKLQGLAADGADDPAQILCGQCTHSFILANRLGERARYHGRDEDNSANFKWHRNCT
jgi:hypothetical protein